MERNIVNYLPHTIKVSHLEWVAVYQGKQVSIYHSHMTHLDQGNKMVKILDKLRNASKQPILD